MVWVSRFDNTYAAIEQAWISSEAGVNILH
jgi:hypothetical protein